MINAAQQQQQNNPVALNNDNGVSTLNGTAPVASNNSNNLVMVNGNRYALCLAFMNCPSVIFAANLRSRDSSPKPPDQGDPSPSLTPEELRSVRLRNQNMRQMIYKEVKKPGRDHSNLLLMLKEQLQGPRAVRLQYIRYSAVESH